jgi:FdhD protein
MGQEGADRRPARSAVTTSRVHAVEGSGHVERPDRLVTEEPLEIRVGSPGAEAAPLTVTMRTPGHDFELTAGLLRTEGVVRDRADVSSIAYCLAGDGSQEYNVVTAALRAPADLEPHRRTFAATASCGLCGKTTLDQLAADCPPVAEGPVVARSVLTALPGRLRGAQSVFDATGGLHAAARFDPSGGLHSLREDIGRHNALDKLVGHAFLEGQLPLHDAIVLVSGRVSFEIVQKAAVAGVPVLCAVSAPSSLAVAAATRLGQTVVGFLRDERFVVYSRPDRIDFER